MIGLASNVFAIRGDADRAPAIVYRAADGWHVKILAPSHTLASSDGLCYLGADLGPFKTRKAAREAAEIQR